MSSPGFAVLMLGLGIAAVLYYVFSSEGEQSSEYGEQRETRQNYQSNNSNAGRRSMSNTIIDMGQCTICLNTVVASEKFTSCAGNHVFHEKCIREWELQRPLGSRYSCPNCRRAF